MMKCFLGSGNVPFTQWAGKGLRGLSSCCSDHGAHDDGVERSDDVDIQRPCPATVVDDCDDSESCLTRCARWFCFDDQMRDQMRVFGREHQECVVLAGRNGKEAEAVAGAKTD